VVTSKRPSCASQASSVAARTTSKPSLSPSLVVSATRLARAPSTSTNETPTLSSTSRSVVVSKTAAAPLRPVSTELVSAPARQLPSAPQVPRVRAGRSKVALKKYRTESSVPPQKPPLSTQPSTVESSTQVTLLAPASRRVWPTLSETLPRSPSGKVYRCSPTRVVAVSSTSTSSSSRAV
jgi:hypothetical protein